jgi:hypothetical protein
MLKAYLALRKQGNPKWGFIDRLEVKAVQVWTKSPYFHSELLVIDEDKKEMIGAHIKDGVRSVPIEYYKESILIGYWEFIEILETSNQKIINTFYAYLNTQYGKKYDWKGIFLTQFLRIGIHCYQCWFCSELTTKLLQVLNDLTALLQMPSRVSPKDQKELYKDSKVTDGKEFL